MKPSAIVAGIAGLAIFTTTVSAEENARHSTVTETKKIELDINKEDRDVGLKRMELLDKALSPELLAKKRAYVHTVEADYTAKISSLLERLTTQIGRNTVITHINVDFFYPNFETEVKASQRVSVFIVLDRTGFERWASDKASKEEALYQMKTLIQNAFKIPAENVTIVVTPG